MSRGIDKPFTLVAFALAALATAWCWWLVGAGLALFLGAILLSALYLPPIALAQTGASRWAAPGAAAAGIAIIYLLSLTQADITAAEWLRCSLVCLAFSFALCGFATILTLLRLSAPTAALFTVIFALAWLTWPVWMSPWLTQTKVDWLVPAHPLLGVNGVLQHLGSWDRAPIAYRHLTILNQDIPYHLPRSIIPAVVVHVAIGAMGLAPGALRPSNRN